MAIIALLSDLGTEDYFVGAMKGVILSINPEAAIVDITHEIPRHSVLTAGFTLARAAETFPRGTIFVAVVDPGVGTGRKSILLCTRNGLFFIGPDNGLFTFAAEHFGVREIRELTNPKLMRDEISATFHGRDVFASVAAHLSLGIEPSEVGPVMTELRKLEVSGPKIVGEEIVGEVLAIDSFGNILTNIGRELVENFASLGDTLELKIGEKKLFAKFLKAFGEVETGETLCYVGSIKLLEIAKNLGNLAGDIDARVHSKVRLRKTGC